MNTLQIFASKLQSVVNDWDSIVLQSVEETKQIATSYNREQMIYGDDADGGEIGRYNWEEYGEMKKQMNPFANGKVDLRLTGDFHNAMSAKVSGNALLIDSSDSKRNKLVEKYGKKIFGLTEKNQNRYKKDVNL